MVKNIKNKNMWFEFNQNNSGGRFDVSKTVCSRLFIEADSEADAVEKAEHLGVYFDGVENEIDCACCGDRWSLPENLKFPIKYDDKLKFQTVEAYAQFLANKWGGRTNPDARIFYKSGRVVEIVTENK